MLHGLGAIQPSNYFRNPSHRHCMSHHTDLSRKNHNFQYSFFGILPNPGHFAWTCAVKIAADTFKPQPTQPGLSQNTISGVLWQNSQIYMHCHRAVRGGPSIPVDSQNTGKTRLFRFASIHIYAVTVQRANPLAMVVGQLWYCPPPPVVWWYCPTPSPWVRRGFGTAPPLQWCGRGVWCGVWITRYIWYHPPQKSTFFHWLMNRFGNDYWSKGVDHIHICIYIYSNK